MPALETTPPEPESGMARVIFETDIRARISRVSTGKERNELLCEETPCAVTLPYGDHQVAFVALDEGGRTSTATIHVRRPTEVVNHAVGRHHANPGTILGGVVMMAGAVLLGIGLGMAKADRQQHRQSSQTAKDLAFTGLGGIVGGGLLMAVFPGVHQEGATTQWSPEPAGRTIGGSIGVRF